MSLDNHIHVVSLLFPSKIIDICATYRGHIFFLADEINASIDLMMNDIASYSIAKIVEEKKRNEDWKKSEFIQFLYSFKIFTMKITLSVLEVYAWGCFCQCVM